METHNAMSQFTVVVKVNSTGRNLKQLVISRQKARAGRKGMHTRVLLNQLCRLFYSPDPGRAEILCPDDSRSYWVGS